ncbi:MAG: hypothetical protein LBE75_03740 [Burkholderiales bacterium]|nr:hypothetical protein [Burkholderiales bacterium]
MTTIALDKAIPYGTTPPPRVALNSLNGNTAFTVNDFTDAYRKTLFQQIRTLKATGETPTRQVLIKNGDQFLRNSNEEIKYRCQRSYNLLLTDGMWNNSTYASPTLGDVDGKDIKVGLLPSVPAPLSGAGVSGCSGTAFEQTNMKDTTVYHPAGNLDADKDWPDPILDREKAPNTVADIALRYWKTALGGNARSIPGDNTSPYMCNTRDVRPTKDDPATWPHLNFYGVGFGIRGVLPSGDPADTLKKIIARTSGFDWPRPVNVGASETLNNIAKVDDLWHASVNGFGRYLSTSSPDELAFAIGSILNEILNKGGARSGVAFTHPDVRDGGQFTYTPSYAPGWGGNIVRKPINNNGAEKENDHLSAAKNLSELLTPTSRDPEPWKTVRQVFTAVLPGGTGGGAVTPTPVTASGSPFASSPLIKTLGSTAAQQANIVAYLRGDRSGEGDSRGHFRAREEGPLGDIVNAKPVVVTAPLPCTSRADGEFQCRNYDERKNPGYAAFSKAHQSRGTMIYAAANDGMLHAFDQELREQWAYIPSDLFRPHDEAGIVNLSFHEADPNTPFRHYYYVDATPRVLDVNLPQRGWRTLLVGGLGKGGTSYYALDVTVAGAAGSEAETAKNKVLWEFTDPNMGYTYGRPVLTKTNAFDGKWVAILPSGHNNGTGSGQPKNGDGKGYLFFVDAENGDLLHKVETPDGARDAPLGLAAIGAYSHTYTNQVTTAVYGGDQQGNLWRFNLESANPVEWKAEKMAVLKDKNGQAQWVTTEPWPQRDSVGNRWVLVGTGGFRSNGDLNSAVDHTYYAFRDGGDRNENADNADTFTDRDPRSTNDNCGKGGDAPCGLAAVKGASGISSSDKQARNGWYEDMDPGYHVNVNPGAAYGVTVYAANKYVSRDSLNDPCSTAGASFTGRVFAREIASAATALGSGQSFQEFPKGIADITLVVRTGENGKDEVAIYVTDTTGEGLDENSPVIRVGGGEGSSLPRVPIRANIHYIDAR